MAMKSSSKRVLVVDDSAFMRQLVSDVVRGSGEFDVVGTARDGAHALEQIRLLDPDVVTLDIDMPGADGLQVLQRIMAECPRPVVMLSAGGSDGGVAATLRALELGAVEFVRKPSGTISLDLDDVQEYLLEALRAAVHMNLATLRSPSQVPATASPGASSASREPNVAAQTGAAPAIARRVVCIASSTGGPAALTEIIPALPAFDEVAVVVAQHMPPGFTRSLAARLDGASALTVREAVDGEPVLSGHCYVAPGGQHVRIVMHHGVPTVALDAGPTVWGVRPAADLLFCSTADTFGALAIGVVLTGMGCDGAEGITAIRNRGGRAMAQDAQTSVVDGMPGAARRRGVDAVAPLPLIAATICAWIGDQMVRDVSGIPRSGKAA
ncbi:MAG: chemotaxis response regulator protein-glutamate methylesterase [Gemmatimonadaceae bacterium]|nr:chemotaxis response regulator protein-glutamate methylesterase [Gemmatimonadaceae bacterium]